MPLFTIRHITKYEYDRPVTESLNIIRKFPLNLPVQETLMHQINISQDPELFVYTDYFQNKTGSFNLLQPHRELTIQSKMQVRTIGPETPVIQTDEATDGIPPSVVPNIRLLELMKPETMEKTEMLKKFIQSFAPETNSPALWAKNCCQFIFEEFKYIKGITHTETTLDEILDHQSGVCQDFAHLMLQLLRTVGIPARYVSGYICPNQNGMRGEGATHAWVEVYLPHQGWVGIDPTNNVWVGNKHVLLATGRNFKDCTPSKGIFRGEAIQKLSVAVSIGYEDGIFFEEENDATGAIAGAEPLPPQQAQQQQ